jgi:DNA-binding NarL/FixJ family response regulator
MGHEGRRVAFAVMTAALEQLSVEDRRLLAKHFAHAFRVDIESEKAYIKLPARQYEVLTLLADGHPAKRIAGMMGIGPRTVQTYVQALRSKLGAANVGQIVAEAFRRGIIS